MNPFLEGLQSYYASIVTLVIFVVIVSADRLHTKKNKWLFLAESILIFVIIAATWFDRYLSTVELGGWAWKLRNITSCINFAMSPVSPAILLEIYRKNKKPEKMAGFFHIPLCINIAMCIISLFNGCIFGISPENTYTRGPLFFVTFVVAGFYFVSLILYSYKRNRKPYQRTETLLLVVIMFALAVAAILEIALRVHFLIWSTTEICVILYFMRLTIQMIMYDDLTGTFSKTAYSKQLDRFDHRRKYSVAMIDMNNLKILNDTCGHAAGDLALCQMASAILEYKSRGMRLYRYGGDEFVMVSNKNTAREIEIALKHASCECGYVGDSPVTFAYGISECLPGEDISDCLSKADIKMYRMKQSMKRMQKISE